MPSTAALYERELRLPRFFCCAPLVDPWITCRLLLGTFKTGAAILDRVTVLVALLFDAEEEEEEQAADTSAADAPPKPDFFPVS